MVGSEIVRRPPLAKPKPEVRIKPCSFQPNTAELEEDVRIGATLDELARAVLTQVKVAQDTTE